MRASASPRYPPPLREVFLASRTHLAVVDADDGADHLGDDDHVAEVGLHDRRLFVGERLLLRLAELLDETHGLALEAALEPSASASVDELEMIS